MKKLFRFVLLLFAFVLSGSVFGQGKLPICQGSDVAKWSDCFGSWQTSNGSKYEGEYKHGKLNGQGTYTSEDGKKYVGEFKDGKHQGQGTFTWPNGNKYSGEFKEDEPDGQGTYSWANGNTYVGEFKLGKRDGQGTFAWADGKKYIGEWQDGERSRQGVLYGKKGNIQESGIFKEGKLVTSQYVDPNSFKRIGKNKASRPKTELQRPEFDSAKAELDQEQQRQSQDKHKPEVEKTQREQSKLAPRLSLQAFITEPNVDGDFVINIQTAVDTISLKVDDEEQGANKAGVYAVRRVARAGATNTIVITAKDIYGNTERKTLSVTRQLVESRPVFARLNPANIKPQPARDAVAIIIGIQNYKLLPKAEYANQDAHDFYDYASRALGITQDNVKLLLDDEADVSGMYKAFQNWLPLKVHKGKTDVYVFYSGHGLPSADGKSLYFLPVGADRDLIGKTAISQREIVEALKTAQPKSVTMFIDSCYSGQIRTGETLLASARPVVLKVDDVAYPPAFAVITASASDQIASSSPDLKHGIFSYYLMKGLEGEADENQDGTITMGKLQGYLADRVPRFAMTMSRKQEPQLVGDANRVLVGR